MAHFYAVDQKSGQQKWKAQTRGPVASSPAVADGLVFFLSYDGGFYCLDANTGARKWRYATGYEKGSRPGDCTAARRPNRRCRIRMTSFVVTRRPEWTGLFPAVATETFMPSEERPVCCNGSLKPKAAMHASPAIAGNTIYIGSWDSYLYALDAESGAEKWRFKTGDDPIIYNQVGFQSSPAVLDGVIYVGCRDAHLYAIDAQTGKKKWDYPTSKSWVNVTPAVFDGSVYFATGRHPPLSCGRGGDGRLRFTVPVFTVIFSSPAIADGLAYFGNLNGSLYAVDVKSGSVVWNFKLRPRRKIRYSF